MKYKFLNNLNKMFFVTIRLPQDPSGIIKADLLVKWYSHDQQPGGVLILQRPTRAPTGVSSPRGGLGART